MKTINLQGRTGLMIIAPLAMILCSIISFRAGGVRAERRYEAFQERFVNDYLSQQEAAERGIPQDPRELLRTQQAQALARMLYGIRDNSEQDLRTACWCVFNRVDSEGYPNTIEEVVSQPQQWVGYSADSPVLAELYRIAVQELDAWQNGTTRPVGTEYVYMAWSPSRVVLRDTWAESSWTNKWRYGA